MASDVDIFAISFEVLWNFHNVVRKGKMRNQNTFNSRHINSFDDVLERLFIISNR